VHGSNTRRSGRVRKVNVTLPADGTHPKIKDARMLSFACKKGDNGSPIFQHRQDHGTTKAKAIGILISGQSRSGRCYYVSMDNAHLETTFRPSLG
jgi:hypothetical protein